MHFQFSYRRDLEVTKSLAMKSYHVQQFGRASDLLMALKCMQFQLKISLFRFEDVEGDERRLINNALE